MEKKLLESYPLDKTESDQLRCVDAIFKVPQEDIIVKTEDLLHVAKEKITFAVEIDRDQWLHLRIQHLILVALSTVRQNAHVNFNVKESVIVMFVPPSNE